MAQAEFIYRGQQLLFPPSDDIEVLEPQWRTNRRQAFSVGGVPEAAMLLPYEDIDARIGDVVRTQTADDLQAWWSLARLGDPYSFAFDHEDKVLTAMENDVAAGATSFVVAEARGVVVGRRYIIMQDLLGRNTSQNQLSAAQAVCDNPAAYNVVYAGPLPVVYTNSLVVKVGTYALRLLVSPGYVVAMEANGPAVPRYGYLTFSIWVRNYTGNRWRLRVRGGGVDVAGSFLPSNVGFPVFRRHSLTVYFPEGASSTIVSIETRTTWHQSILMVTDAWQAELKQHATPWMEGATQAGLRAMSKTVSTEGLHEIVKVIAVTQSGPGKNRVQITAPLKFSYAERDAFRSLYYWERVVSLDADTPLRLKMLTSEFRHRFREIA